MRKGNVRPDGQPWTKKQTRSSRFMMLHRHHGFMATQRTYTPEEHGVMEMAAAKILGKHRKKV